jgi:hypothetical protein
MQYTQIMSLLNITCGLQAACSALDQLERLEGPKL